mgnify:CR=1 FL=1
MNPVYDVVCVLLETPFSRWKDEDKKEVLNCGLPTESLQICGKKQLHIQVNATILVSNGHGLRNFCGCVPLKLYRNCFVGLACFLGLAIKTTLATFWNREGFAALLNIR